MNRVQCAEQMRRILQIFAQTLTDEEAMEVSTIYPDYVIGKSYKAKEMFSYGVNNVGDPQIYRVVQDHVSQADWTPKDTPSLYTPVGLTKEGYPIWSQPTGTHDAYNNGDVVEYNGVLYKSLMDGNIYPPDIFPSGWEICK